MEVIASTICSTMPDRTASNEKKRNKTVLVRGVRIMLMSIGIFLSFAPLRANAQATGVIYIPNSNGTSRLEALTLEGAQARPEFANVPFGTFKPVYVHKHWMGKDKTGTFHSQAHQDRIVHMLLGKKKEKDSPPRFFIDLAANEPIVLSNSRALERDFGWNGLCIEANPVYWQALVQQRRCKVIGAAISKGAGRMKFRTVLRGGDKGAAAKVARDGSRLGGLVGDEFDNKGEKCETTCNEFTALTLPLSDVLPALAVPSRVDYFSLDIEGAEYMAMLSFPWEQYRFTIMTVERPKARLKELLSRHGYEYVCDSGDFGDELWLDRSMNISTAVLSIAPTGTPPRCDTSF